MSFYEMCDQLSRQKSLHTRVGQEYRRSWRARESVNGESGPRQTAPTGQPPEGVLVLETAALLTHMVFQFPVCVKYMCMCFKLLEHPFNSQMTACTHVTFGGKADRTSRKTSLRITRCYLDFNIIFSTFTQIFSIVEKILAKTLYLLRLFELIIS